MTNLMQRISKVEHVNNQKLQKRIQEELDFDEVMRQRTQLGFTGLAEE